MIIFSDYLTSIWNLTLFLWYGLSPFIFSIIYINKTSQKCQIIYHIPISHQSSSNKSIVFAMIPENSSLFFRQGGGNMTPKATISPCLDSISQSRPRKAPKESIILSIFWKNKESVLSWNGIMICIRLQTKDVIS